MSIFQEGLARVFGWLQMALTPFWILLMVFTLVDGGQLFTDLVYGSAPFPGCISVFHTFMNPRT